jgi:hypothetical protein
VKGDENALFSMACFGVSVNGAVLELANSHHSNGSAMEQIASGNRIHAPVFMDKAGVFR